MILIWICLFFSLLVLTRDADVKVGMCLYLYAFSMCSVCFSPDYEINICTLTSNFAFLNFAL